MKIKESYAAGLTPKDGLANKIFIGRISVGFRNYAEHATQLNRIACRGQKVDENHLGEYAKHWRIWLKTVNATLTQLSSKLSMDPDVKAVKHLIGPSNEANANVRTNWRSNQQMALSHVDDYTENNELFELFFNDERYLPFEGTSAVSPDGSAHSQIESTGTMLQYLYGVNLKRPIMTPIRGPEDVESVAGDGEDGYIRQLTDDNPGFLYKKPKNKDPKDKKPED